MTTLDIIKDEIKRNQKLLDDFYEDDNDPRNECHPDIERIRQNIVNLEIMYVRLTTCEKDIDTLIDKACDLI